MEFISTAIKNTGKNQLIAITCVATLVAPYVLKFGSNLLMASFQKQKQKKAIYVGIELGGTNYNVAIGRPIISSKGQIIEFQIIKRKDGITYEDCQQTLKQIIAFIVQNEPEERSYDFIGISSFGPLCLDRTSPLYGSITSTPKKMWRNFQLLRYFKEKLKNKEIQIDTDVNSAALAQFKLGHHNVKESLVYITIGTGVGVGVVCNAKTVHGLTHPQGGHIVIDRHREQYENFTGVCPYHTCCLQGMVCNKAIADRLSVNFTHLHQIADSQKVWKLVGYYLAQLCLNITLTLSPQVIVIGGGIMNRKILYKYARQFFLQLLAKYVQNPLFSQGRICNYIKEPALGSSVGVKGAMMLKHINQQ